MKRGMFSALLGACLLTGLLCIPLCKSWGNGSAAAPAARSDVTGAPKAVAETERYEFGVVEVDEECESTFMVRNDGNAPLFLSPDGASCGCIKAEVVDTVVPPGKRTGVIVTWKPYKPAPVFVQHAKIRTNDPKKKLMYFEVAGRVSNRLGVSPPVIVISAARPWEQPQASSIVYSQEWNDLKVTKVESFPETMQCEVLAARPDQLATLNAKSAFELKVTLPPGLPRGPFEALLRVHAQSSTDKASAEAAPIEIPVQGYVSGYFSIYGLAFDSTSGALLVDGAIVQGERRTLKCVLSVFGNHQALQIRKIQAKPEFLRVSVTPEKNASKPGRYSLVVEIPPDARPCNYGPTNPAEVSIVTDHPITPEFRFKVQFVIRPRDPFRD